MNINSIPAGRELDALVAEKVMGEYPVNCWIGDEQNKRQRDLVPHYSTDMVSAWKVVEKVGLIVGKNPGDLFETRPWIVVQLEYHEFSIYAAAETAPLAICLAALKAVGA